MSSARAPLPQDSPVRDGTVPPSPVEQLYDADYSSIPDELAISVVRSLEEPSSASASTVSHSGGVSTTQVNLMPPPSARKPKRKFKGHSWSRKGTKSSRAARKLNLSSHVKSLSVPASKGALEPLGPSPSQPRIDRAPRTDLAFPFQLGIGP